MGYSGILGKLLGYGGQVRHQTGFKSIADELAAIFGAGAYGNDAGIDVSEDAALRLSVYWACVRAISEDVAKRPLKVFSKREGMGRDELPDHPVYHTLQVEFHPELDAFTGRQLVTQWAVSWGNGYAEIQRAMNGRVELFPIHPSRVQIVRVNGRKMYRVHGDDKGIVPVDFATNELLHIRGMGDEDQGWSVARYAAQGLGLALAAEKYGAKYFRNNARPSIVLETDKKFKDLEAIKNFRKSWQEVYGNEELGGTAIAEDGLKVKVIGLPNEDAQFILTRQHQDVDIVRWFRMKPHKVGILDKATFSNIGQESLDYYADTIMAWDVRWEKQLKVKLFADEPSVYAEHIVTALLRGDALARSQYYRERFNTASMTPNEIRDLENENPVEGGDRRYIQSNMVEIGEDGSVATLQQETPPSDNEEDDETDDGLDADATRAFIKAAHVTALSYVAARMDRVAVNAKAAAKKKGLRDEAYSTWLAEFNAKHEANVTSAFIPVVESLCSCIAGTLKSKPDLHAERTHSCTRGAVGMFVYDGAACSAIVDSIVANYIGGSNNED